VVGLLTAIGPVRENRKTLRRCRRHDKGA